MMTVSNRRKAKRAVDAEALAVSLDLADAGREVNDPRAQVASRLRSTAVVRETPREQAKARMLRAFGAETGRPGTADAGSRDSDALVGVHTAKIELPGGVRVLAADVEPIDGAKAEQIARSLETARITGSGPRPQ